MHFLVPGILNAIKLECEDKLPTSMLKCQIDGN